MKIKTIITIFSCVFISLLPIILIQSEKSTPVKVMDDERISVRFNADTLINALECCEEQWGKFEKSRWGGKFTISASSGNKFYDVLLKDSSAIKISENYSNMFKFIQDENGAVHFTMPYSRWDNYIIVPTWILVTLIENEVLKLPNNN